MIFPNQLPELLQSELDFMAEVGARGIVPGTPEFTALAEAGERVIWVAPEGGGILVAPVTDGITHAALANGANVVGAGEAELILSEEGTAAILEITAQSGHYLGALAAAEESEAAIAAGVALFEEYGVFLLFAL
jgi:hypothetical protein